MLCSIFAVDTYNQLKLNESLVDTYLYIPTSLLYSRLFFEWNWYKSLKTVEYKKNKKANR